MLKTLIFFKFILPILIISGVCTTAYFIFTKPQNMYQQTTEARIGDIKDYEHQIAARTIDEIANEKILFYLIVFGQFAFLAYSGFQILNMLLKLDSKILLYPEKYNVIPIEEADCVRYLRDKLMEANIISDNEILLKEHIYKLLTYLKGDNFYPEK